VGGGALCVRLPPAAVGHDGEVPEPRNACGCECHYGAEAPLAEFRVRYLSRVSAQQSGYALRDLCRGCYREMRHADRVRHFVNWWVNHYTLE